jgi:hypothetical protein
VVVTPVIPASWRAKTGGSRVKAGQAQLARDYLKKKKTEKSKKG